VVQTQPEITQSKRVLAASLALILTASLALGCGASERVADADVITVEGRITARGNTPFQAHMIETDDRNIYVLAYPDDADHAYTRSHRYRVVGELYKSDWNGVAMAHLRVRDMTDLTN